jgi:hypothetical protein
MSHYRNVCLVAIPKQWSYDLWLRELTAGDQGG